MTYTFILDRLAIGSKHSRNVPGWTAIVSVVQPCELQDYALYPDSEITPLLNPDCPLLLIPIQDGEPGIRPYLDQAIGFIREHLLKGVVLVHCGAGRSRSASIVVAYLVSCGMSIPEAEAFIKYRKKDICPASCFLLEIKEHFDADKLFHSGPARF